MNFKKMQNFKSVLLLLSLMTSVITISASASIVRNNTVSGVFAIDQGAGVAFVYLTTAITGVVQCGAGNSTRYSINLNTNGGRAMYATAMAAHASGKPIDITGSGNCTVWGDTEGALYMYSHN